MEECFHAADPDQASSQVIADSLLVFGIQALTQGRPAFINLTRNLLISEHARSPV